MPVQRPLRHLLTLSLLGMSGISLAGCSSSSLADSPTASTTAPVSGRVVNASLTKKSTGTVSKSRVGLVSYATGIDANRGQIVAVAGIANGARVGAPVTEGTVTYATRYNYQIVDDVVRSKTHIIGRGGTRAVAGRATLTANFDTGRLTGNAADIDVKGRINGQVVRGTVDVDYSLPSSLLYPQSKNGSITADLNGQIGDNGVIATFDGSDANTVIAGGLVGIAN